MWYEECFELLYLIPLNKYDNFLFSDIIDRDVFLVFKIVHYFYWFIILICKYQHHEIINLCMSCIATHFIYTHMCIYISREREWEREGVRERWSDREGVSERERGSERLAIRNAVVFTTPFFPIICWDVISFRFVIHYFHLSPYCYLVHNIYMLMFNGYLFRQV